MFKTKTVFVLGAGASAEARMPLGWELLEDVKARLDYRFEHHRRISGDNDLLEAIKDHWGRTNYPLYNRYILEGHKIVGGATHAVSLDDLLYSIQTPEATWMGKLAIVRAIHQAEAKSLCSFNSDRDDIRKNLHSLRNTWYHFFFQIVAEGRQSTDRFRLFEGVSFINFNYDRTLENYLTHAVQNHYSLSAAAAREVAATVKVIRPYGMVGKLPWMPLDACAAEFGCASAGTALEAFENVRTYTEQLEDSDAALLSIREELQAAGRIVFLGFAFHRQNLEILKAIIPETADIVGTAMGFSLPDKLVLVDELCSCFGLPEASAMRLEPVTCANFMAQNARVLTSTPSQRKVQ
jgi:hypothetical protein